MSRYSFEQRSDWFELQIRYYRVVFFNPFTEGTETVVCHCCGYPTIEDYYDTCILCEWCDYGLDMEDNAVYEPLDFVGCKYSLYQARLNFRNHQTMYDLADPIYVEDHNPELEKLKTEIIEAFNAMIDHDNIKDETIWRRLQTIADLFHEDTIKWHEDREETIRIRKDICILIQKYIITKI